MLTITTDPYRIMQDSRPLVTLTGIPHYDRSFSNHISLLRDIKTSPDQSILQPLIGLPFTTENTELLTALLFHFNIARTVYRRMNLYNDHYMQ